MILARRKVMLSFYFQALQLFMLDFVSNKVLLKALLKVFEQEEM